MTQWTRTISRIVTSFPAWRQSMTVAKRLYNVSTTGPSGANALIVWPTGTEAPAWQFAGNGGFSNDHGNDVMTGYASGTILEDVGPYGTIVFGTGGHSRFQNQLLGLPLGDASPAFTWFQQPKYEVSAINGAEIFYSPTLADTFPENRRTLCPSGGSSKQTWDGGFPMSTRNGWVYPAKLVYGQLGGNAPHGFRYNSVVYVPAGVTGNGDGAFIVVPTGK